MKRNGGHLVSKIHHVSGRVFSRLLKEYRVEDINPAQGRVLFPLWKDDGISIQELAERTALGKSTLTRMLDRLENDGQVRRVPSPDDRRKIMIFLTEKNKEMRGRYEAVSERITEIFYGDMDEEDRDRFEGYLERVYGNIWAALNGQPDRVGEIEGDGE